MKNECRLIVVHGVVYMFKGSKDQMLFEVSDEQGNEELETATTRFAAHPLDLR